MPKTDYSYRLINTGEQALVTLYVPGRRLVPASDSHPSFDAIIEKLMEADQAAREGDVELADEIALEAADLFDIADAVKRKFEALAGSERLTIKSGQVYLDGDAVDNAITEHIVQMVERGEDFAPLVRFYEKLLTNPLGHAREALYPWMGMNQGFTITPSGMLVGYKSMYRQVDEETGEVYYVPTRNGGGIVNGVEYPDGPLKQKPGDVVEMARSIVLHEPSQACGVGLHIGTSAYAFGFSGDAKMEVHFDPRDVVNVPNGNEGKIRVCRYTLVRELDAPYTEPIVPDYEAETEPEEDTGWLGEGKEDGAPTADDLGIDLTEAQEFIDAAREFVDTVTQDARDALGRWVAGRKSQRDPKTGRFIG